MDPTSFSQRQLCQWAEEMGYILPSGRIATTSDLAAATSTPARRRLWEVIIRKLKDRRTIRKYNHDISIEKGSFGNFQNERVELLRCKTDEVDYDIEQLRKKIIQRILKIRRFEQCTKESNLKILLLNKIRNCNMYKVAEIQSKRISIQSLSSSPEMKLNVALNFLKSNVIDMRRRWFDPALMDEMMNLLKNNGILGDGLWISFINCTENFEKDCNLRILETEKALSCFRSEMVLPPLYWGSYVKKQRINTMAREGIVLLLRGAALKKIASKLDGSFDKIQEILDAHNTIIEKTGKYCNIQNIDETVLNKLRFNCDDSQKAYDDIKNKSSILLSMHKNGIEKSYEMACSLNKKLSEYNLKIQCNVSEWRSLLHKWSISTKQHIDTIWHLPLSQLRTISEINAVNLLKSDILNENLTLEVEKGINIENMRHFITELEKRNCLEVNPDHWRKIIRNLEKTRDRANNLNDINQKINQTIQIYCDQPFSNMIPNSLTVSNLTFKELRLQFNLMRTPRRKY